MKALFQAQLPFAALPLVEQFAKLFDQIQHLGLQAGGQARVGVVIDQLPHRSERVDHAGARIARVFKLQLIPRVAFELWKPEPHAADAKARAVAQHRQCCAAPGS